MKKTVLLNFRDFILRLSVAAYKTLRPFLGPASCRYYPSCSAYAVQAVKKHGIIKGGLLAARRIIRCNPFSDGGYDPVP